MNGSRIVLLIAVLCFVVGFLEVVTGSKLLLVTEGWLFAGLAFFAAAGLV